MSSLWTINTSISASTASRLDFGSLMILGNTPRFAELYREYGSLDELAADYLSTDLEYKLAAGAFAQVPRIPTVKIGRRTAQSTPVVTLTPVAVHNAVYSLEVNGSACSYTADSATTVAEICTGLKAAIDALAPAVWQTEHAYVVGDIVKSTSNSNIYINKSRGTSGSTTPSASFVEGFTDGTCSWDHIGCVPTVVDGTSVVTLTSTIGQSLTVAVSDSSIHQGLANLLVANSNVAALTSSELNVLAGETDFYAIAIADASKLENEVASSWAESAGKLFLCQSNDSENIISATGSAFEDYRLSARTRTVALYHKDPTEGVLIAAASFKFTQPVGANFAYSSLAGISVNKLSTTQKSNLYTNFANSYCIQKGINVLLKGQCSSGTFIDLMRSRDALADDLDATMLEAEVNASASLAGKIPYTDPGTLSLAQGVGDVLNSYIGKGFLAAGSIIVSIVPVSSVTATQRATRLYPYITWTARLQGAINGGTISGVVTA